ncbi:MAG: TrmH family RNA methyltransferase [Angustibacter sp.]
MQRLRRRVDRERADAFVVEGARGVLEALLAHRAGRAVVRQLYVTADAGKAGQEVVDAARGAGIVPHPVSHREMALLATTVTPAGVLAVCRLVAASLDDVLQAGVDRFPRSRFAVLDSVRDPGNAGTVIRAADASGAAGVVLAGTSVDLHNPKCVRATAGSLFHLPVAQSLPTEVVIHALRAAGVTILAAAHTGDSDLDDLLDDVERHAGALLARPSAWVFGTEAQGLPSQVTDLADAVVRVPLHGSAESLNLAMAATVCLYASARAHTTLAKRPGQIGAG